MAAPKTPNYLGQYNKYMGAINKYSPYLQFMQGMSNGGNAGRAAAEAGLDYGISTIPGYGQIYQGAKLFNQATGGINFNKMIGMKNPLSQMGDRMFGRKKTAEEEQAADPEYAKYMGMLSDMQNSSAATERSALEKRQAIQPMQEKAVGDYMDMLQNGLSSRQLAPVYAAGEARNRAIGASAEAGLMSQVANRGMGGGIQAGLEAAVQGNRNALSADLNSRITQQQIAARPAMLGQAANMTMSMENQVQQQLAQAAMERMNASQIGLSAYNANQQVELYKQQLADARRTARNTEVGAMAGRFGPDIVKGIQGLLNKGKLQPGAVDAYTPDTSTYDAIAAANPSGFGIDYTKNVPTPTEMPDQILGGFTMPTMRDAVSPQFQGGPEMPVSYETSTALNIANPNAQEGQTAQGPDGLMYKFSKGQWTKSYGNPTIGGLNKKPFGMQEMKPDINNILDMTGGMLSNTGDYPKFW
jgi:hypothetical protein